MTAPPRTLLAINSGSSTLKFAAFLATDELLRIASGTGPSAAGSAALSLEWLSQQVPLQDVSAIGHRVVLSARRPPAERVTTELIEVLREAASRDPDHLPAQLGLIEAMADRFPALPQIACYDSTFHDTMPRVARVLPIPRRFDAAGIQRFGFHGLSCAFLMEELSRIAGPEVANGRVILAHLGGGASITAVRHGSSLDTSMGFTPAGGLMMGTRTGDIDPGLALAMMKHDGLTPEAFDRLINAESGLLGVSGTTSDMRTLTARQSHDAHAAEAIHLFCYQARKWIGAYAAVLGGLDTIVFTGGIGENVPEIRDRICANLAFLGIEIDPARNTDSAPVISSTSSVATVRVIRTDEELIIARAVWNHGKSERHGDSSGE